MFKSQDCDSITVPACNSHNNDKGEEDHAIIHGFLLGILNNFPQHSLTQRIQAAVLKAEPKFNRTKRTTRKAPIISGGPEFSYTTANVVEWMRQLTAGLVYDALQHFDPNIPWEKAQSFSPSYIEGNSSTPTLEKLEQAEKKIEIANSLNTMKWLNSWAPKTRPWPSDLYSFEFCMAPDTIWFKHNFYESYQWYVGFSHTPATSKALTQKSSP